MKRDGDPALIASNRFRFSAISSVVSLRGGIFRVTISMEGKKMNPYQTPCEDAAAVYDRSLLRRVMKFIAAFAIFMAILAAASSWRYLSQESGFNSRSPIDQVRIFFTEWNRPR